MILIGIIQYCQIRRENKRRERRKRGPENPTGEDIIKQNRDNPFLIENDQETDEEQMDRFKSE